MRRLLLLALLATPLAARAQDAPLPQPGPALPPIPAPRPAATPPSGTEPSDTEPTPDQPPPKPPPTPTPAPPLPTWQPRQTAVLQALDKIDGASGTLTIPVGGKQTYRNITIEVRSCYARPPDQAQDATANVVIQDKNGAAPSFVGWLLAAEPAASMMEHPVYDVRVLGCR